MLTEHKLVHRIGMVLIAIGTLLFCLGLSTYLWPTTQGWLKETSLIKLYGPDYSTVLRPQTRYRSIRFSGFFELMDVEYSYGVEYNGIRDGRILCICIPITRPMTMVNRNEWAKEIDVKYFPPVPQLSVLIPGPDIALTAVFILLGASLIYMERLIFRIKSTFN